MFRRALATVAFLFSSAVHAECAQRGFSGSVSAEWDEDGRTMTLLQPLSYVDPRCLAWDVPAGTQVDGASIPRAFWAVIGGPFSGRFRGASVVHDRYCVTKDRDWRDVHRMFYDAMLDSDTPRVKAKVMYYAVLVGGPRWKSVHHTNHEPRAFSKPGDIDYEVIEDWGISFNQQLADSHVRTIEEQDLSLAEIEALATQAFKGTEPPNRRRIDE